MNPPRQSEDCYQSTPLPPSHHGWVWRYGYYISNIVINDFGAQPQPGRPIIPGQLSLLNLVDKVGRHLTQVMTSHIRENSLRNQFLKNKMKIQFFFLLNGQLSTFLVVKKTVQFVRSLPSKKTQHEKTNKPGNGPNRHLNS